MNLMRNTKRLCLVLLAIGAVLMIAGAIIELLG